MEPDSSISENNRPLLCLNFVALIHNRVVMSEHKAVQRHMDLSEWLPQLSCLLPPAHIQPSHAPPYFLNPLCGKPRAMKGWIVP